MSWPGQSIPQIHPDFKPGPSTEPSREFKGVWICAALWEDPELNPTEKFLIAEVDSLCGNGKACFASNEFLARRLQTTPKYMNNMLYGLTRDGYLVRLAFTGRQTLRCVHPLLSSNPATVHALLKQYKVERSEGESWESRPHKKVKAEKGSDPGEGCLHENVKAENGIHKKLKPAFPNTSGQASQKREPEISRDTKIETSMTSAAAQEEGTSNLAPLSSSSSFSFEGTSFLEEQSSIAQELGALAVEFGITSPQALQLSVYAKRQGIDYVREKAAVVRSEPRDNLARAFMGALKGDWKLPKRTPKPARIAPEPSKKEPATPAPDFSAELRWWQDATEEEKEAMLARKEFELFRHKMRGNPALGNLHLSALRLALTRQPSEMASA